MGGADKGGVFELWKRGTNGGLGCGEKADSEEGQNIGFEREEQAKKFRFKIINNKMLMCKIMELANLMWQNIKRSTKSQRLRFYSIIRLKTLILN